MTVASGKLYQTSLLEAPELATNKSADALPSKGSTLLDEAEV